MTKLKEARDKIINELKPGACYMVDSNGKVGRGDIVNKCGPGFKCEESCPICLTFRSRNLNGERASKLQCTKISKRSAEENRMPTNPPKYLLKFIN